MAHPVLREAHVACKVCTSLTHSILYIIVQKHSVFSNFSDGDASMTNFVFSVKEMYVFYLTEHIMPDVKTGHMTSYIILLYQHLIYMLNPQD